MSWFDNLPGGNTFLNDDFSNDLSKILGSIQQMPISGDLQNPGSFMKPMEQTAPGKAGIFGNLADLLKKMHSSGSPMLEEHPHYGEFERMRSERLKKAGLPVSFRSNRSNNSLMNMPTGMGYFIPKGNTTQAMNKPMNPKLDLYDVAANSSSLIPSMAPLRNFLNQ